MGIVRRQSSFNLIYTYLGVALGFVNKLLLFAEILSKGQFGAIELLLTFMLVGTELAVLGSPKIVIRFFPHFREHPFRSGHLTFFLSVYSLLGFLLLTAVLLLIRPWIMAEFQEDAPLFADAYYYTIPLSLAFFLYRILAGISGSLYKSVLPNLANELILRLLMTGLILGYYYDAFAFPGMLRLFTGAYFVPPLILVLSLWGSGLRYKPNWGMFRSPIGRIMIRFGLFSTLSDATIILVQRIDSLLVGAMLGEVLAGSFGVGIYFAALIGKPSKAMGGILAPLLATAQQKRDFTELNNLYHKSALNSLLIGGLLFIGLWVNIDAFFEIFPTYANARNVALLLGASLLISTMTGPHRWIILNTRYYRFDLWTNLLMLLLVVLTDLWLIPLYGIEGAAVATLLITILRNVVGVVFVRLRLGLQSLYLETLQVTGIFSVILLLGLAIPALAQPWLTMLLRSALVSSLFAAMVYWLPFSPELKELVDLALAKVGLRRRR